MDNFFTSLPGYISSELLPQSGSSRQYWRIFTASDTVVGVKNVNAAENRSFIEIARHLHSKGIAVPQVFDISPDCTMYTQQDLGRVSLHDNLSDTKMLLAAVRDLAQLQFAGRDFDFNKCFSTKYFGERIINFDLNYFKYCFVRTAGIPFDENALQDEYDIIRTKLLSIPFDTFFYRDFQSRNVMICDGKPYFIDFQGGFCGPVYYDLASFVYHSSAAFPQDLKEELLEEYYESLKRCINTYASGAGFPKGAPSKEEFRTNVSLFALFRILQEMGAFGLRGLTERKPYFLESIPRGVRNLGSIIEEAEETGSLRLPELRRIAERLIQKFCL